MLQADTQVTQVVVETVSDRQTVEIDGEEITIATIGGPPGMAISKAAAKAMMAECDMETVHPDYRDTVGLRLGVALMNGRNAAFVGNKWAVKRVSRVELASDGC